MHKCPNYHAILHKLYMWFGKNELRLYLNRAKIYSIGGAAPAPSKCAHMHYNAAQQHEQFEQVGWYDCSDLSQSLALSSKCLYNLTFFVVMALRTFIIFITFDSFIILRVNLHEIDSSVNRQFCPSVI